MEIKRLSGDRYEDNPRYATADDIAKLQANMEELGDLSGIILDINTNQYCGGNQRSEILKDGEVVITDRLSPANAQGTVAYGYVRYKGERFTYREVDWTQDQCRRAVITANSLGGKWDFDLLANRWDDLPLFDMGVPVGREWSAEPQEQPDFQPTLAPQTKYSDVTEEEIQKKAKELAEQMVREKKNADVMCPHCGHEFKFSMGS